MPLPPGPLNGAPVGGNQGGGEVCCPPALNVPTFLGSIGHGASVLVPIAGMKISAESTVEVRQVPTAGPPTPVPAINGTAFIDNADPLLDEIVVDLDTSDAANGPIALVVTNPCGCCAIFNTSIAGAP